MGMPNGPMSDNEQVEMLRRASNEIKHLRSQIDRLAPKADAYDKLSQVLGFFPQRGGGMGEDVAWMLDRRAADIESRIAGAKAAKRDELARAGVVIGESGY